MLWGCSRGATTQRPFAPSPVPVCLPTRYEVAPGVVCFGRYAPAAPTAYKRQRALPPQEQKALLQARCGGAAAVAGRGSTLQ